MKYKILFLLCFVANSMQAMNSGSDDLESGILNSNEPVSSMELDAKLITMIQSKKVDGLEALCQKQMQVSPTFRSKGKKNNKDHPLKAAQAAATENIKLAENNLGFWTNTSRRNLNVGSIGAILLGLGKGIYDITQFWDPDVSDVANSLSIAVDASAMTSGMYGLILAWENGSAYSDYNQAVVIKALIDTVGNNLQNKNLTVSKSDSEGNKADAEESEDESDSEEDDELESEDSSNSNKESSSES